MAHMELRGALNLSKYYREPNQPRFYGRALINGILYDLKGWEKTNAQGEPWISLLFEIREQFVVEESTKPVAPSRMFETPRTDTSWIGEDDIPF
jgi:hypothetical protein